MKLRIDIKFGNESQRKFLTSLVGKLVLDKQYFEDLHKANKFNFVLLEEKADIFTKPKFKK